MNLSPETFVRRQRRRSHGTPLAWGLATLAWAVAWAQAAQLGWISMTSYWALLPAGAGLGLLYCWVRLAWGAGLQRVARECDDRWALKGRVESALELAGNSSAVAVTQRAETAALLEPHRPVGTGLWLAGWMVAALGVVVLGHQLSVRDSAPLSLAPAQVAPPVPIAELQSPVAPVAPVREPLRASLVWKTPGRVIRAIAVETVPLVALAESNRGFTSASLNVSLNGATARADIVDPALLPKASGSAEVKLSLYLDEVGAEPFDVVSYHLVAHANTAGDEGGTVTSSLQFVEVVAPASVVDEEKLSPGERQVSNRLNELKLAQVELMARAFEAARDKSRRTAGDAAVASGEETLAKQLSELREVAAGVRVPDSVAGGLSEAEALARQAASAFSRNENESASRLQGNAIAVLARSERAMRRAMAAPAPASVPDDLAPRETTPAGRLEALAKRQADVTRQFQLATRDAAARGKLVQTEREIARDTAQLLAERGLTSAVQGKLQSVPTQAEEAALQLALQDPQAAVEPLLAAQSALDGAVQLQDEEGRRAAEAVATQAEKDLTAAEQQKNADARRAELNATARELSAEAKRQNEQGSSQAARRLAERAKAVRTKAQSNEPAAGANAASGKGGSSGAGSGSGGGAGAAGTGSAGAGGGSAGAGDAGGVGSGGSQSGAGSGGGSAGGGGGSGSGGAGSNSGGAGGAGGGGGGGGAGDGSAGAGGGGGNGGGGQGGGGDSAAGGSGPGITPTGPSSEGTLSDGAFVRATSGDPGDAAYSNGASRDFVRYGPFTEAAFQHAIADMNRLADAFDRPGATFNPGTREQLELLGKQLESLHRLVVKDVGRGMETKLKGNRPTDTITAAELKELAGWLRQMANTLEQERERSTREQWKQRYNPEDVDPNYRKAVEDYFETLSREDAAKP